MAKNEKKNENLEQNEQTQSVEEATNNEASSSNDEINELKLKYLDSQEKYLRVLAEYDNFRKRSAKEREHIYSEAYMEAVKGILPVIDNIERVLTLECDEKFLEGFKLIITSAHAALEKMGVKEIETKTFDPNLHNAVMHIDDESLGEGEIVEVFQKGYTFGDKVIRYAMVKVAN